MGRGRASLLGKGVEIMNVGTKSVLFGAHCFFLHPFFVASAWRKLYGLPLDPRIYVAFMVHDLGYLGKPNMDGPEGEKHVELGAKIMHWLFDRPCKCCEHVSLTQYAQLRHDYKWHDFCLYHSRYYAKKNGAAVSKLCFADKLSFALTPAWLYLPMVTATGEIDEYLKMAQKDDSGHWKPTGMDKRKWHTQLCEYMRKWVEEHLDGRDDTWTDATRNTVTSDSGVWK
jgi:hypothetical protein